MENEVIEQAPGGSTPAEDKTEEVERHEFVFSDRRDTPLTIDIFPEQRDFVSVGQGGAIHIRRPRLDETFQINPHALAYYHVIKGRARQITVKELLERAEDARNEKNKGRVKQFKA